MEGTGKLGQLLGDDCRHAGERRWWIVHLCQVELVGLWLAVREVRVGRCSVLKLWCGHAVQRDPPFQYRPLMKQSGVFLLTSFCILKNIACL